MACPKTTVRGKSIILLSGYRKPVDSREIGDLRESRIEAVEDLRQSAKRHPDAVAFGYVAGKWMPAA